MVLFAKTVFSTLSWTALLGRLESSFLRAALQSRDFSAPPDSHLPVFTPGSLRGAAKISPSSQGDAQWARASSAGLSFLPCISERSLSFTASGAEPRKALSSFLVSEGTVKFSSCHHIMARKESVTGYELILKRNLTGAYYPFFLTITFYR